MFGVLARSRLWNRASAGCAKSADPDRKCGILVDERSGVKTVVVRSLGWKLGRMVSGGVTSGL
jgi:hypothetical protein